MISLCTVILDNIIEHSEILLESIKEKTTGISEVLMAKVDSDSDYYEEYKLRNNIVVKKFGAPVDKKYNTSLEYGHALGLHECIDKASKEWIMICEPDLFFYTDVPKLYFETIEKYNLNIIGISHHNGIGESVGFFCYPMNSMMRKSSLPKNGEWMKKHNAHIKIGRGIIGIAPPELDEKYKIVDEKYLLQGVIPEIYHKWPNPEGWFDIGCNLWLWNEDMKGKWLSFQTMDTHIYSTNVYKTNFKLRDRFKKQKLLYHQTNCVNGKEEALKLIKKAYKESKND